MTSWRNDSDMFFMFPINKTHRRILAILTSMAEGTMRKLAESSCANTEVWCRAGSTHDAVHGQQRLCASQFSQLPGNDNLKQKRVNCGTNSWKKSRNLQSSTTEKSLPIKDDQERDKIISNNVRNFSKNRRNREDSGNIGGVPFRVINHWAQQSWEGLN